MIDFITNLFSFIVALSILVAVHEYGHFWVARKNGVIVERFSIGFGPALWRKKGQDGTEYVLALIPLGGYVKMLDERVDEVSAENKDKAFNNKSVYQRIAIIAAGPLANFVFAIFAFYLMFLLGVSSIKPIVGEIAVASIAAQAKLPANIEIVEVAGKKTSDWQAVNLALVGSIGDKKIEIKARRDDSQQVKSYWLATENWQFAQDKVSAITSLGLIPYMPKVHAEIAIVSPDSPAEEAGLQVGDKLLRLDGEKINNDWRFFSNKIKQYPGIDVKISIERNGAEQNILVTPRTIERDGKRIGQLGVSPKQESWPKDYWVERAYGPIDALEQSLLSTGNLVVFSFELIGKLFTGDISLKTLSGPISIAQGAGQSAGNGLVAFLAFLALISINLGIINLLPLPVLDGGHLFYYFIELVTGKPVPEKVQEIGFRFGAIALLGLMSIALFNDFSRL